MKIVKPLVKRHGKDLSMFDEKGTMIEFGDEPANDSWRRKTPDHVNVGNFNNGGGKPITPTMKADRKRRLRKTQALLHSRRC